MPAPAWPWQGKDPAGSPLSGYLPPLKEKGHPGQHSASSFSLPTYWAIASLRLPWVLSLVLCCPVIKGCLGNLTHICFYSIRVYSSVIHLYIRSWVGRGLFIPGYRYPYRRRQYNIGRDLGGYPPLGYKEHQLTLTLCNRFRPIWFSP